MDELYQPLFIEQQAQKFWQENQSFAVKKTSDKEKFYCLSMFPYPSGDLHMGHIRNYTIGDVIARYQWLQNKQVLHPIGWDAFGLPAENAAIANKQPPAIWTMQNIERMRSQFKQMGYSFDWSRELKTCDPSYYRWEQWLFVQLFNKGLIYKKNAVVNWDPVDHTVLANEQVIDGRGWRSGALVERREIPQWFIKITAYADELLSGLDHLPGWPERVRTMQRNWIGRSQGINIDFTVDISDQPTQTQSDSQSNSSVHKLTVFTTRADTLFGVAYIAIAPEHPLALIAAAKDPKVADFIQQAAHTKVAEADIATQEKLGICLQTTAIHPLTGATLPIWVANFVLMQYGSGAVMAVPAHDQRDFEFAQKYSIPFIPVIEPANKTDWDFTAAAYTEAGILINSNEWNGLDSDLAKQKISEALIAQKHAQYQINYRLRDWGISRQRYWGTPIPIIHCSICGDVAVPETDLPVVLPTDLIPEGSTSPLKSTPSFYETTCPQCKAPAHRETDTMDTFIESSWYYARFCCNDQDNVLADERCDFWVPVDQYVGGVEHAILHLLYARFIHKLLRDFNLLHSDEPFLNLLTQGMVLKDSHKMSKSKGNVVAPQALVEHYGADTVRFFIIFAAPPEQSLEWSDHGVEGAYRFLRKVWQFAYTLKQFIDAQSQKSEESENFGIPTLDKDFNLAATYQQIHQILQQAQIDMQRQQFNTVASAAMKLLNLLSKMPLSHSSASLPTNPITSPQQQPTLCSVAKEGMSILLRILSPITPHICHYLWRELGYGDNILQASWPEVNLTALSTENVDLVIQINGKLRGHISVPRNSDESVIKEKILCTATIQHHLIDKSIKKMIIIPNKLVNIVI